MRITIEPTKPASGQPEHVQRRVVVEHPYDDLPLEQMMRMWADALRAYSFYEEQIEDWIEGEEPFKTNPATGDAGG